MTHDVFISYAHSDDEIPAGCDAGWVSTFVQELGKVLRRRIGGPGAEVWSDHQLASNELVTAGLMERAATSRTIVLFLSNGYLASDWCRLELDRFLLTNAAHKNRESVFVVELEPIDRARWPPRLRELTPVCLYEFMPLERAPSLLGYPNPPLDSRSPYWLRLNTLAHLIHEHLLRIRTSPLQGRVPDALPQQPRACTVWVAMPPPALGENWESLVSALRQAGADVRPPGRHAYLLGDAKVFRDAVEADLTAADLWIQLLDREAGPVVAEGARSTCALQAMVADLVQASTSGARFLQWRSPEVVLDAVQDEHHRRLLLGTTAQAFEAFRLAVLDAFADRNRQARPAPLPNGGGPLRLCVTAGPPDQPCGLEVCRIVQELGHEALPVSATPAPGQAPAEFRAEFVDLVQAVDGVILVRGVTPPSWLQSRYAQLSKLSGGRTPWGALLEAPGAGDAQVLFTSRSFDQLDCRAGIREEPIARFLKRLREVPAHG